MNNMKKADHPGGVFGAEQEVHSTPKFYLPRNQMPADVAYQILKDEAMLDGNARMNLATFVTTWMDDKATKIMSETMDKNMIDKTEYPQTAEIERRCVNMLAKLWNTQESGYCTGVSTVGSSEACMLGGLAALFRWKEARRAEGKSTNKPNFVISSAFQVVWEKFAHYWELEMRCVPISRDCPTLDAKKAIELCDENTFCIVPIQGVTMTGLNDNVRELDMALDELNERTGWGISIHVDAATGGFILPFLDPEQQWDFRLKWVKSISTSGHKFGLVYPGVGWVVWRDRECLPDNMVFNVNYLGENVPTIAINFSRPASQILAQYYQFIRLGFEGYKRIQQNCMDVTNYLMEKIQNIDIFKLYSPTTPNPLFAWELVESKNRMWTLYDLSERLNINGWQVPAYTLPDALEEIVVMRIVVRQGTSRDLADMLLKNLHYHIEELEKLTNPTPSRILQKQNMHKNTKRGFTH